MKVARIVFTVFLSAGVFLLAAGAYTVHHTRQFLKSAVETTGMVIENVWQESTDNDGNTSGTYHPRVSFRTQSGRKVVFLSGGGSMPAAYRTNDAVPVLYDPRDPTEASIKGWTVWIASIISISLGLVFSTVG